MIGSPQFNARLSEFVQLRRRTFYPKTDLEFSFEELRVNREQLESDPHLLAQVNSVFSAELPMPLERVELLRGTGTFHLLFRATTSTGARWFLRAHFANSERPAFELLLEEFLAARLGREGLPVPRVTKTDFSRSVFPLDWQIRPEAAGIRLTDIENPETQFIPDAVLEDLGRTLARVHQVKGVGAGLVALPELLEGKVQGVLSSWGEYIFLNLEQHLDVCQSILAINASERAKIREHFEQARSWLDEAPQALLHGDPGHHNIYMADQKIAAILDWEDALVGDPLFDVAHWGTFARDYLRVPFLRGYAETVPLPADLEKRFWLYYLRISLSKTVHRHFFGTGDRPGRPPASQRIQKALAHLGGYASA